MGDILDIGSIVGAIELEDHLTPAVKSAMNTMMAAGDVASKMGDKIAEAGKAAEESGSRIVGAFKFVGGAAASVVGGITAISGAIMGLAAKGSRLVGIEDAFTGMADSAGIAGDVLIKHLDKALKSTVDQTEQMQAVTTMLSSNMKVTAKNMDVLGSAARAVAKATGGDTAGALNQLSNALARGQDRILRRIGITINAQEAERKYAASLGTTAEKLSPLGTLEAKRIAMLEAMEKYVSRSGDAELGFGERLTQARLAIENFFDDIAKATARSTVVTDAFQAVADGIYEIFGADFSGKLVDTIVKGIEAFARGVQFVVPYVVRAAEAVKDFWRWLEDLNERFQLWPRIVDFATKAWGALQQAFIFVRDAASAVVEAWKAMPGWLQTLSIRAIEASLAVIAIGKGIDILSTPIQTATEQMDLFLNVLGNIGTIGVAVPAMIHNITGSVTLMTIATRVSTAAWIAESAAIMFWTGVAELAGKTSLFVAVQKTVMYHAEQAGILITGLASIAQKTLAGSYLSTAAASVVAAARTTAHTLAMIAGTVAARAYSVAMFAVGAASIAVGTALLALKYVLLPVTALWAGWKIGEKVAEIEVAGLSIGRWVSVLGAWILNLGELSIASIKASEQAAVAAEKRTQEAAARIKSLMDDMSGDALKQAVSDLNAAFTAASKAGSFTGDDGAKALERYAKAAADLADRGARLTPQLDRLARGFKESQTEIARVTKEAEELRKKFEQAMPVTADGVNNLRRQAAQLQDRLNDLGVDVKSRMTPAMLEAADAWRKMQGAGGDLTTFTKEVRAMIQSLSGIKAVQDFGVLASAFSGLSATQRENTDIVGDVIDRYVALHAQIRELPASMAPANAEMEKLALSIQRFTLPKDWLGQARNMMLELASTRPAEALGSFLELWKKLPPEISGNKLSMTALVDKFVELRAQVREMPPELAVNTEELTRMALAAKQIVIGPELLSQINAITKQMAGGDAVQRMLAINAAWHNQTEEVRDNVAMQRQWGAEFWNALSGAKNVPAFMASVISEMGPLMNQARVFAMEVETVFSGITNSGFGEAQIQRAEKFWMDMLDLEKGYNDALVKGAMSSNAQRAVEIVRTEKLIRNQKNITAAETALSQQRELLGIAQIIASSENWKGELNQIIAQMKAYGEAVPEDKLRGLVKLLVDVSRHRASTETLKDRMKELGLAIPDEVLDEFVKKIIALQGTSVSAATGLAGITTGLDAMSTAFADLAQIAGDSLSDTVRSIGTIISSASLGLKSVSGIKTSWKALGDAFKGTGADGKKSILGIVGAIGQFGGAIGSAISAVMSFGKALKDAFDPPNWKRAIDEIKRTWAGVGEISENVAKQIEKDQETIFKGMRNNRWAAEVYNLGKIIDDVGLSAKNFTSLLGQMRNAFSFVEQGLFSTAQATEVLDQSFMKFVDFLGGNVTPALKEIIALNDKFGTQSKAIADYIDKEANKAATALASVITTRGAVVDALAEAQKKVDELVKKGASAKEIAEARSEVEKLQKQLAALPFNQQTAEAYGSALLGIFARLTKDGASAIDVAKQLAPAVKSLESQLTGFGNAQRAPVIKALDEAKKKLADLLDKRDLTPLQLDELIESGKIDAELEAAYDAVMTLEQKLNGLPDVSGPAFDQIKSMVALATDEIAGPALQSIQDLGTALEGLNNSNILTPEMFAGITQQISATVEQLKAQGKTTDEIYPFIASSLQTIWELQQDYGYAVDDATQALLDQAVADGKVGETHRSVQEQMLRATQLMTDAIVFMAQQLGYTVPEGLETAAGAFSDFADDATDDVNRIPTEIDIKVTGKYTGPQLPGSEAPETPGGNSAPYMTGGLVKPIYASTGFFVPTGSDTVPAMLTKGEGVLSVSGMDRLGRLALEALNSGSPLRPSPANVAPGSPSGGGDYSRHLPDEVRAADVTIVIQALDAKTVKDVVERDVAPVLNDVWRRNARGTRTDAKKALGV